MDAQKKLVYADDVLKEILKHDPKLSFVLDRVKAVDAVEVVHGRWIVRGGKRYCSACQQRACVTRDMDDFWYTVGTDYCPNCGAKMDGGNEDG